MRKIAWSSVHENVIDLISKEWMLVTAGTADRFNTMTASWGGVGFLWGKPVAFVFIRPERYTHEFVEANSRLTLSFLGDNCREAYQLCGTKSGRDTDKVKESGLQPIETETGSITFAQARLVLDCRKLYKTSIVPQGVLDAAIVDRWYNDKPGGGYHDLYVVEIEQVYTAG